MLFVDVLTTPATMASDAARAMLARCARERTLLTLLLTASAALAVSQWAPRYEYGTPAGLFWAGKLQWRDRAEVVVAGDSRVVYGVAPGVLAKALPGKRVVNFGFHGLGYTRDYLDRLDRVLAKDNGAAVVLGITPLSLTDRHARRNRYTEWRNRGRLWPATFAPLAEVRSQFQPISPSVLLGAMRGRSPETLPRFVQDRRAGGWIRLGHTTGIKRFTFADYRQFLEEGVHVNDARVEMLLEKVRCWRAQGIEVYAFRPPIPRAMRRLEQGFGLDYGQFIQQFNAAGGRWIPTPQERFESLDGSHLAGPEAKAFSRYLGDQLARPGDPAGCRP